MSKTLKPLNEYVNISIEDNIVNNSECGYKLNPTRINSIDFDKYYFKIYTYDKEESLLIYNNYINKSLYFSKNGNIQVLKNKTKFIIQHNFCNGKNNKFCITDNNEKQNTYFAVDDIVKTTNPIYNREDTYPDYVFTYNGNLILKFNYTDSQNKSDNNLINVSLHINPFTQHFHVENLNNQAYLKNYYSHCERTDFKDPNCPCINIDIDNYRGNLCFANLYGGFKNSCLIRKANSNGTTAYWSSIKQNCPLIAKSDTDVFTCSINQINLNDKKIASEYIFKSALYDLNSSEWTKNKNINYKVCQNAFDANGNINVGGDINTQCNFDSSSGSSPPKQEIGNDTKPGNDTKIGNDTKLGNDTKIDKDKEQSPSQQKNNYLLISIVIISILIIFSILFLKFLK